MPNPRQTKRGGGVGSSQPEESTTVSIDSEPLQATVSPQAAPPQDVTVKDWLDADEASVSELSVSDVQDGTAPFDTDDGRGNDQNAGNKRVRSFDQIVYTVKIVATSDDDMAYYRNARIGVKVTIPVGEQQAQFDTAMMGWADQTKGYEAKVTANGDGSQTYSAYLLMSPTSSSPTRLPGTVELPIAVDVKAMTEGQTFAPTFEAWTAPNDRQHRSKSITADPVTVTSKPNYNVRVTSSNGYQTSGVPATWDFTTEQTGLYASDGMNRELGKQTGILSTVRFGFDLRNPDRSKALKGTELPQAGSDITFTLNMATTVTDPNTGSQYPAESQLQPYFWAASAQHLWQKVTDRDTNKDNQWYPRYDDYNLAGPSGTGIKYVYRGGNIEITQTRHEDHTEFTVTIHDWAADVNKFPVRVPPGNNPTSTQFMDSSGTELQVGEISVGHLYLFTPATIDGTGVVDHYGGRDVTMRSEATATGIRVTGESGAVATEQTVTSDDTMGGALTLSPKGDFFMRTLYSCSTLPYSATEYRGTDCVIGHDDTAKGTDTTTRSTVQRIQLADIFTTSGAASLTPVFSLNLAKIDPTVLEFTGDLHAANPFVNTGKATGSWRAFGANPVRAVNESDFYYAVKKDGSAWKDDEEQRKASIDSLDYYASLDEAKAHGTIVGLLIASREAGIPGGIQEFWPPSFMVRVRDDAPIGATAQLTQVAQMFTRQQLVDAGATPAGLTVDSSIDDWQQYATGTDPLDLSRTVTPVWQDDTYTGSRGYHKSTYDKDGNYIPGTEGNRFGDTLLIVGENTRIGITTAQAAGSASSGKTIYDLDKEQRYVDWAVTVHSNVPKVADKPTTTARVTVTLPKGLRYEDGSATYDGEYTEATPQAGSSTGMPLAPDSVTAGKDGSTMLTFTIADLPCDDSRHVIHLTAYIGDPTNPDTDAANGQQYTATASVLSTNDHRKPSTHNGKQATSTIRVSRTKSSDLATQAAPLFNEAGSPIGFTNMIANSSKTVKHDALGVIVTPADGQSGSIYHGAYAMGKASVTASGLDVKDVTVKATADSKYASISEANSVNNAEVSTWATASVSTDGTVTLPALDGEATALAVQIPSLEPGAKVTLDYEINPTGNQPGDLYVNRLSDTDNMVTARTTVANRTVNGIVFVDANRDGVRADTDKKVEGVTVMLVSKANPDTPITLLDGSKAETTTGDDGAYEFAMVPAGEYQLRFAPADDDGWLAYDLTVKQAAKATDSTNSDADPIRNGIRLTGATISISPMPALGAMTSSRYTDQHEDVGLICLAASDGMPFTGSIPWLYILLGAGMLAMIGASVVLLRRR